MELRKRHALHDSDEIAILQEVSGTGTNKNQAEGEPGAIAEEPHHGRRVSEDRGVGERGLPAAAPLTTFLGAPEKNTIIRFISSKQFF